MKGRDADPLCRIGRRYLGVSLFFLGFGSLLGAGMLAYGNDNFQFFHGHMMLVGTVLFALYGAGLIWASSSPRRPHPGWAGAQFHLSLVGLAGMLAGSVLPVGYGLDRLAIPFGVLEALAAVMYGVLLRGAAGGRE